jgi:hypothetical protein
MRNEARTCQFVMTRTSIGLFVMAALLAAVPAGISSQAMPDPREMSGVPLPVSDVAAGTVTVRVIRGSFANPVPSQTVELTGGATPVRATTDDAGRAEFSGLASGTRLIARAVVAGQSLHSQEFTVPASGGIRLILVATDSEAGPAPSEAAPVAAEPGALVLGEESRFVFEMGEDGLSVFYALQVLNRSDSPVVPEPPLVFELPAAARSATLLDGSSPRASVAARELHVSGPFPPGPTVVQLAYTMPLSGPEIVIEQPLPARLAHVAVVAQKVGEMELASPQVTEQRTMPAQGHLYIAGRGGAVQAGEVLRFHFTGVPHHPTWPRNLALALAVLILAGGAWSAIGSSGSRRQQAAERRQLEARREQLFEELGALEVQHRDQRMDPEHYAARRRELVAALEAVYAALDDEPALGRAS